MSNCSYNKTSNDITKVFKTTHMEQFSDLFIVEENINSYIRWTAKQEVMRNTARIEIMFSW